MKSHILLEWFRSLHASYYMNAYNSLNTRFAIVSFSVFPYLILCVHINAFL